MSLPVIAIVGRPNVGKSSLFNALTRSRDALVAAEAGLTRDRQYGIGRTGKLTYLLIDTGGLMAGDDILADLMARQVRFALDEADLILFVTDARDGLLPADETIARELRRTQKPVSLIVNKTDGLDEAQALGEFHALGLGEPRGISAAHRRGLGELEKHLVARLPAADAALAPPPGIPIALVGRPNAGKSTLLNRLVGTERVLTEDAPGTTRDSINVPFTRSGVDYVLVDTAGIRRRARVGEGVEKLSVIKSLRAIEEAQVVVLLLDARRGISDQDAHIAGLALEAGRAMVFAVNKWEGLDPHQRKQIRGQVERKLGFANFVETVFISALQGTGLGRLMAAVKRASEAAAKSLDTNALTRILADAVSAHAPPMTGGRAPKLRYAHAGGHNPPRIIIHGNRLDTLPQAYRRYLVNTFRQRLRLTGTPIRIVFKGGENPYAGRKNPLTPRQQRKRKRLLRHVKR